MTILGIFDCLINTYRLWNSDGVVSFRAVSEMDHLVKRMRIGSWMNKGLHIILIYVVQVKLSDFINLTSVFSHC